MKYLHSIGILHSDVKPDNILYQLFPNNISFKLCDFNISQIIPVIKSSNKKYSYNVFATEKFSDKRDKKNISIDVYMLGSTLLYMCLSKYNLDATSFGLRLLNARKNIIIDNFGNKTYDILNYMLQPQLSRHYFDIIDKILKSKNKININNNIIKKSHHKLCDTYITNDFFSRDINELCNLGIIINIYKNINDKNIINDPYNLGLHILSSYINLQYNIDNNISLFLAQSIIKYPNDECCKFDIFMSDCDFINFDKKMDINFHLITCKKCLSKLSNIFFR